MTEINISQGQYNKQMLARLKEGLFQNQTEKLLSKSKISKSHEFVHPKYIPQITTLTLQPKTKSQLLNFLSKNLHAANLPLRIKSLIVLHACVRYGFDEQLCELAMGSDFAANGQETQKIEYKEGEVYAYLKENCVDVYLLYIKKMCGHRDTFIFVRDYTKKYSVRQKEKEKGRYKDSNTEKVDIQIVNHGFKVLNLARFLLQMYEMFNKMGRYYIEYQEIISMFLQVLQDLDLFNSYINKTADVILTQHPYYKISKPKPKTKNRSKHQLSIDIGDISLGVKNTQKQAEEAQKLKHFYLYINQCQSVADQLYEFFHNRYYFKHVKNLIIFPAFLSIRNKEYNRLTAHTKRVDSNLVHLVKASKYGNQQHVMRTETSFMDPSSYNRSHLQEKMCKTQLNISVAERESVSANYDHFFDKEQQYIFQQEN